VAARGHTSLLFVSEPWARSSVIPHAYYEGRITEVTHESRQGVEDQGG